MTRPSSEPKQSKFTRTYLGFDYGSRKIGIAVGQNVTQSARDLDTVGVKGGTPDWNRITEHISTWQPVACVVGIPLDSNGQETTMAKRARKFGQNLSDRYNLPIHWVNEYLTSEEARLTLSRRGRVGKSSNKRDQVAARLILETFLREHQTIK